MALQYREAYWRYDTKKNLILATIGKFLERNPGVIYLKEREKDDPWLHLNRYEWVFKYDERERTGQGISPKENWTACTHAPSA